MNLLKGSAFDMNHLEELVQKAAWRLVRSAQDKMGAEKGAEKRIWAIEQLKTEFPALGSNAEHYIRAAYVHFKNETR